MKLYLVRVLPQYSVVSPLASYFCQTCVLSSGSSEACVPGAAVPGGGADTDGVHHVWRLEVWTGKSLPAEPQQQSSFHVLHPPRYAHFDPESPIFSIGNDKKKAETANRIFLNVCIHDPGILSVLWLVVAACQYRLRAGPPVRVSADCVKGGEGRGVCFAKQQRRGVSHKFLSTGWSLHGPHVVHTQPVGHCLSPVNTELFFSWFFSVFICTACSPVRPRERDTSSCLWFYFIILFIDSCCIHEPFVLSFDVATWLLGWGVLWCSAGCFKGRVLQYVHGMCVLSIQQGIKTYCHEAESVCVELVFGYLQDALCIKWISLTQDEIASNFFTQVRWGNSETLLMQSRMLSVHPGWV